MYAQGLILLAHLAAQGWRVGANDAVVNTHPYLASGIIHLISMAIMLTILKELAITAVILDRPYKNKIPDVGC